MPRPRQSQQKFLRFAKRSLGALLVGVALAVPLSALPEAVPAQDWLTEEMDYYKYNSDRWIEINLSTQRLIAWEWDTPVYAVIISTGTWEHSTPTGSFAVQSMHVSARMQGDDYDVPDVPFVMYYDGNYAIHGAYWHNSFGTPVSHGCTNVAVDHAEWLYYWASIGTPVVVHY